MRVRSLLFISAFCALISRAAPVPEHLAVRKFNLKPASKPAPKIAPAAPAAKTTPAAVKTTAAAKTTAAKTTTTASSVASPIKSSSTSSVASSSSSISSSSIASSSVASSSSSASASSTSAPSTTSSSAAATSSAGSCPLYTAADATDLSERDLPALEKRANEEFWFRFEDPSVTNAENNILQLAARKSPKNFDDQAYKWISTDVSKVTRGKISGRVATVYVLPAGTRQATLGAAENFEETSAAEQPADFVTKDNEPGDVGINGVQPAADGALPLDTFRDKVIRTVVKTVSAKGGGKATFTTITKGKKTNGASKGDQAALQAFC